MFWAVFQLGSVSSVGRTVYKTRAEFASMDDYATYIRDNIAVGMTVKCCQTYEEVHENDLGRFVKVNILCFLMLVKRYRKDI